MMRVRLLAGLMLATAGMAALPVQAQKVAAATPAPSRFDTLVADAKQRMVSDPDAALDLARQAERAVSVQGPARATALATALWLQGEALVQTRRADQAGPLVERALALVGASGGKLKGDLLLTRGGIRTARADVGAALSDYQAAHRAFAEAGEARSQAIALITIASLFREGADFESALKYYGQALDAYTGDPMITVSIHNNRGNVLNEMKRHDEAAAEFARALTLLERLDSPMLTARVLGNLARAQVLAGHLADADRSATRGLALVRGAAGSPAQLQLLSVAARVALERGQIARARVLVEKSFGGIATTATTLAFRDNHQTAYLVYDRAGDTALALAHLAALRRLDDQATELATSTKAALMSARFDFANQELRIARLKAEELRRNVDFERTRARSQLTLFIAIGVATAILIALLSIGIAVLRRRRNQLAASNVKLEKALAAKTEFLATTSHEIRTPLNGILGMTQVMLADSTLAATMRDRIGVVHGAGVTMCALVDDILDVAKMETGNLTIETAPLDLPATLREVTRMWEEQARAKGLLFALDVSDDLGWIESDAGRLRQIVFNLLSNAIKFTASGAVTVRASLVGEGDARRIAIAVRDSGIGIPADKHAEIFESFKQVDAGTTRQFGGTGLGLTICRNLARALGGEVAVASEPGAGATFTLDLPWSPVAAPDGVVAGEQATTLLILDRNPIARSMLKTLLEPRVDVVRFAASAAEASSALADGGITFVLIDEGSVQGEDGTPAATACALACEANQAGARVAIMWRNPSDEDRAALIGEDDNVLIAKPISGAAMVQTLFAGPDSPWRLDKLDIPVSRVA